MNLPININDLLKARTVEWERLEFKEGWNPEEVMHSLCAFANDFHNLGGGYIIIGIKEENGRPVLPPKGLHANQLDRIQKDVVEIGHKINPFYHPIMVPHLYEGKQILILWAIGGQSRPYKAPVSLSDKNTLHRYYIRKGSVTVSAKSHDEQELFELASKVPFDDRAHHTAAVTALDLGLIRAFLQRVQSDLFSESVHMDFTRLCRQMNIVDGPDEHVRAKNVGLLFFSRDPSEYFPQTQIDIVHFPDGLGADSFSEKVCKGPVQGMLEEALTYIQNQIIEEKIVKNSARPEADRFYNYPYSAIKEALCNAVYHRSYEIREPVEIRIMPDRITIGSFPGPDRSITNEELQSYHFTARRYRNRRVGEFLKELDMTEGRGTGIPKMIKELQKNNSPMPTFKTDEGRSYFIVEFPIHPLFHHRPATAEVAGEVAGEVTGEVLMLLVVMKEHTLSRSELQEHIGTKSQAYFRTRYLKPALSLNLIEMINPQKPNSSKQKYRLTKKGKAMVVANIKSEKK